jgi:hypothetical protein
MKRSATVSACSAKEPGDCRAYPPFQATPDFRCAFPLPILRPIMAKPTSIIAQLEGSGTADSGTGVSGVPAGGGMKMPPPPRPPGGGGARRIPGAPPPAGGKMSMRRTGKPDRSGGDKIVKRRRRGRDADTGERARPANLGQGTFVSCGLSFRLYVHERPFRSDAG